jgi:arsenate reductase
LQQAARHHMSKSDITIYHNPNCSTSQNVLGFLREAGHEPKIVEYLKTPLSRAELAALIAQMGVPVKSIVREKESLFRDLKLENASDDALLDAMAEHPILMNRPSEAVKEVLAG